MPTDEFLAVADYALGEVLASLPPIDRAVAMDTDYDVLYRAEPGHKAATGTPQNYILLGMYQPEPRPHITIFEESIKTLAHTFGNIHDAIKEVLQHEIFQHRFGLDHTKETLQLGLMPAAMVHGCSCSNDFVIPYMLPNTCKCGQSHA